MHETVLIQVMQTCVHTARKGKQYLAITTTYGQDIHASVI